IICSEKTDNTVINNANGELSFTFSDAGTPQSVNCLFINSFPNLLVKVSVEPIGATCPNGGVQIDTGEDDNQNNMLDPGEVDNTFHICNGVDGQDGQDGQDGDDDDSGPNSLFNILNEPPGSNCQAGGVRVQTGIDDNMNGILEPSEVDDTAFICNGLTGISGPPGEDGDSDSDDDGCELFSVVGNERVVKTRAATVFVIYSLIPGFIVLRRYRRRRNRDN
ncbi:MAG: hypothetical protein GTO02_20630, partial [Candidatus Dadabacteria bacterium]|nr:hypothetical protein [Candidatus Dadabacteria bacterium]NIQ16697.1 hypothetical protein [Candidatus Dadabacteria bacterium]